MQLDPVAYSKGGASRGGSPQAQQHIFYSNLIACLNAKISTKLRLKMRIKTLKKNQKLLVERLALCP